MSAFIRKRGQSFRNAGFVMISFIRGLFENRKARAFAGSEAYWIQRYASGGTSGPGSYDRLAEFKGEVLNSLIEKYQINSVIEFGCGDGNQLLYTRYPVYLGIDVSADAVGACKRSFSGDGNKRFLVLSEYRNERAEMAVSLDVIFHLVEDEVFEEYMARLFMAATRLVVIYSSNTDESIPPTSPHVKHRQFARWIERNAEEWLLGCVIKNRFPYTGDYHKSSFCDFYIYWPIGKELFGG